jgi:hypothetical protein
VECHVHDQAQHEHVAVMIWQPAQLVVQYVGKVGIG